MRISIYCIGKLKESYWREAIAEYSKRIQGYAKLEIYEFPDCPTPEKASISVEEEIKRVGNMLIRMKKKTGSLDEYQNILKNKVGNPDFKCNKATEEQREALDLVYNELLKLGYEYTEVIRG